MKSKYDVCLIDLGFSQFNIASEKGFSYMSEEQPLDMRYDGERD